MESGKQRERKSNIKKTKKVPNQVLEIAKEAGVSKKNLRTRSSWIAENGKLEDKAVGRGKS